MWTHIQKWGNSLRLSISIKLAKQSQLHAGSPVILGVINGQIVIQPTQYNLEKMLNDTTPNNQHHLILDDKQQGLEEW